MKSLVFLSLIFAFYSASAAEMINCSKNSDSDYQLRLYPNEQGLMQQVAFDNWDWSSFGEKIDLELLDATATYKEYGYTEEQKPYRLFVKDIGQGKTEVSFSSPDDNSEEAVLNRSNVYSCR